MTDNLRARIAAAVCNWYYGENTAWEETSESSRTDWRGCADAVIEALQGIVFEGDTVESPGWGGRE